MNRRLVVISLGIATLIGGAIFFWTPAPKAALPQAQEGQAREQPKRIPAPPQVVYSALFHHVVDVKEQAEAEELQGKDASSLRSLFRERADLRRFRRIFLIRSLRIACVK